MDEIPNLSGKICEAFLSPIISDFERPANIVACFAARDRAKLSGMEKTENAPPVAQVAVVMGSQSDWETMKNAVQVLAQLEIAHFARVISAHRTPQLMAEFAQSARANGLQVIIAGAGGAAHLPGMIAAQTSVPVLGVPVQSRALNGMDSLLSIVQMPAGIPVATLAIGAAGATNAALLAAAILANHDEALRARLDDYRAAQTQRVLDHAELNEDK